MVNKDIHTGDDLHLTHTKSCVEKLSVDEDKKYREILKELGFEKPKGEPLTEQELRQIFISMQEDLFIGS